METMKEFQALKKELQEVKTKLADVNREKNQEIIETFECEIVGQVLDMKEEIER